MLPLLLLSIRFKIFTAGYFISSLCLSEKLFLQVSHILQCLQACCCYIYWKSVIPCRVGTLPIAGGASGRLTGLGLMDTYREVYVSKYLLFFQKYHHQKHMTCSVKTVLHKSGLNGSTEAPLINAHVLLKSPNIYLNVENSFTQGYENAMLLKCYSVNKVIRTQKNMKYIIYKEGKL